MRSRAFILLIVAILTAPLAGATIARADDSRTETVIRFMHGVYACGPEVVEELAADDIVISYPIFQKIFGSPALNGRDAALEYTRRFCTRFADAEFTIHETVAEGNRVVVLWSYQARSIAEGPNGEPPSNEILSWGGITFYRFNDDGKITLEVGEESDPGPFGRISSDE